MLNMSMFVLFGWFISHYAKNNMPRLIWISTGVYVIVEAVEGGNFIYNPYTYFGLGLLLPHLYFLYDWIKEVFNTLKLITFDTYYFFITVYYKVRNTFYWFIDFYEKIQAFFYERTNKKAYEKFYKDSDYEYEEPIKVDKEEYTYEQQRKQRVYEDAKQEEPRDNSNYERYKHFYSNNVYVVLGVSPNDDYKTIKKTWRGLQHRYHTDKNHNESSETLKLYTEISQLINNAWDEIEVELKRKK